MAGCPRIRLSRSRLWHICPDILHDRPFWLGFHQHGSAFHLRQDRLLWVPLLVHADHHPLDGCADEEMPGMPPFEGLFEGFLRLAGASLISFGAAFALFLVAFFNEESSAGSTFMIPALVLGCLYFPMALLAVAMKDTPLAANPLIVVPAIFKAPLEYLVTVLVLAGVMGFARWADH